MNREQAKTRVREFLCRKIEITPCRQPPNGANLYEFDSAKEELFTFSLFGHHSVGGAEYISVDRESGEVRYLGFHGE